MDDQTATNINCPSVTKRINVTDLTANQKRKLFIDYLNQAGFSGFAKRIIGEQIYYIFTYQN